MSPQSSIYQVGNGYIRDPDQKHFAPICCAMWKVEHPNEVWDWTHAIRTTWKLPRTKGVFSSHQQKVVQMHWRFPWWIYMGLTWKLASIWCNSNLSKVEWTKEIGLCTNQQQHWWMLFSWQAYRHNSPPCMGTLLLVDLGSYLRLSKHCWKIMIFNLT